ncbi:spore coat protein U domain-containing protein [Roseomonas terrae]|jgi:spore coat protein U-like protein|uniref:Spore coat protein U domain-containing protein n=1 Tax=Neoroseomonas terrae TaxID=424799 RepID=A0ABS5EH83_9PROT|nr:spore coat U domain-containing protein [Neoroseomonas terrae]MBR0650383.1 spore coat protein U domain-containing protein [Neoroseomonas terrae]
MKRVLTAAAFLMALPVAARAQCSVTAVPVTFATYQPFAATSLDSTGSITLSCLLAIGNYTVTLGPGGGSVAARRMANGPTLLSYQLYTTAARTTIWGDGTGGTVTVPGSCLLACVRTLTIYGRVPARQVVRPGAYLDTILVTMSY